jgi:hypothetical protein
MIRTAVYGDDRDLLAMRQGRGSGPRQERLADARTFFAAAGIDNWRHGREVTISLEGRALSSTSCEGDEVNR